MSAGPMPAPAPAPAGAPQAVQYVGFWARVLASFVDTIAVLFVVVPLAVWYFGDGWASATGVVAFTINYVLPGMAVVVFWIVRGATPGKMVISAVIVDADTFAAPTPGRLIARCVAYYLSLIPLGLGFLWVAFDARKQGWHDKIANTVVIKGRR